MSYDISLRSAEGDLSVEIGDYTYNCSAMFYQGTDIGLNQLNGMKAKDALPILKERFDYMHSNPKEMRAMNPSNGWGNYEGFLEYVGRVKDYCERNPEAILEVY